jgi:Xaa-Pro dipeptidase
MTSAGLDALLITSQANFTYVTGYRTPSWLIKSRPLMALVPSTGAPIAILSATHAGDLEASGPPLRLHTYSGFEEEATDGLIGLLQTERLTSARIGIESGREQRLGMPLIEFGRLTQELERAELRDAASALWKVRMIKSDNEISRLRTAGQIAGEMYESLLRELQPGWTEKDVYRYIAVATLERGGDAPGYVTITAGPGGYHRSNAWPRERRIERGELFWVDVAATFDGYYSDYTRCAAIGSASAAQRDAYQLVLEMLDGAVAAVRPGAEPRAIMAAASKAGERKGMNLRVASRVGHGVGLDLTEPPSLSAEDRTPLVPGMVLAVEPGMLAEHGWYHLEENVLVTGQGCELLSAPQPRELPVATGRQDVQLRQSAGGRVSS